MLIFPLALALAIFAAGYEMFGPGAGLLAMLLFALEPMILANSGLVTIDIPLSCTLFLTVFAFYQYLKPRHSPGYSSATWPQDSPLRPSTPGSSCSSC